MIDRHRSVPAGATIANSAEICLERDATYRPSNLSLDANHHLAPSYKIENVVAPLPPFTGIVVPSNSPHFDTGFDIVVGKQYRLIASGNWIGKTPPINAGGVEHPGGIREAIFSAAGLLKRMRSAPWMALLGQVGTGDWFLIGLDTSPRTLPPGRLFCCANDAPEFYFNNRGSVQLHIDEV